MFWAHTCAALAVAGLACAARAAGPDVTQYATGSVLAHWDGIANAGADVAHDAAATTWTDLSGNGNDLTLDTALAAFTGGNALYCNGSDSGSGKYAAKLATTIDTYQTVEVCFHRTGSNEKQLILHSGNGNQYRYIYDMYRYKGCMTFSINSPSLPIGDTSKSTNTVAGVYASSSAKCISESYLNGTYGLGTYGENMHSGSGFFTLGENYNSSRLFQGQIFAVRLYGRKLTNAECRRNAALDEMRFRGASPEDVRWNDTTGKLEFRFRFAACPGTGSYRVNGSAVAVGTALWYEDGTEVSFSYGDLPSGIAETGAWSDVPYDATLSADGRTVTVTMKGPLEPTYKISAHTLTTEELVSTEVTARRIVNGDRIVYVFTNVNEGASVTLLKDMTLRDALVVGGGNGSSGGTVLADALARPFNMNSAFTVSIGKANTASTFTCVGAELTAAGGAGTPTSSDITGESKTYGNGGTGTVILSFTEGVVAGQPEIREQDPVITFPGEYTFPHVALTLSGASDAVYAARVTVEFGLADVSFVSSNVFVGVANGQSLGFDASFAPDPGATIAVRVTVAADGAETRTKTKTAVAVGTLPHWVAVPASAYPQSGLVAFWDGFDNVGKLYHDASSTDWKDLVGGYTFALTGATVSEGWITFTGSSSSYGLMSYDDTAASFGAALSGTLEVCEYTESSSAPSVVVQGGDKIVLGRHNDDGSYGLCTSTANNTMIPYNWAGSRNTIAVHYSNGNTGNCYINGTLGSRTGGTQSFATQGYCATVGNRQSMSGGFNGKVYAVRLYSRQLTALEIDRNYQLDEVRYSGLSETETGVRWNREKGDLEESVSVSVRDGKGTIAVNGTSVGSSGQVWVDYGSSVTVVFTPAADVTEVGWRGMPSDAVVSADGRTVTFTATRPYTLQYDIAQDFYVTADPASEGTGLSWSSPVSLSNALALATGGCKIFCRAGRYRVTSGFSVTVPVDLRGGYAGTDDMRLADDPVSVFDAEGSTDVPQILSVAVSAGSTAVTRIARIAFVNAAAQGLVTSGDSSVEVRDCRFEGNGAQADDATYGPNLNEPVCGRGFGATGAAGATLTISNCVFAGNIKRYIQENGGHGYGLYASTFDRVTIDDSLFITNGLPFEPTPATSNYGLGGEGSSSGIAIEAVNAPLTVRRTAFACNRGFCRDDRTTDSSIVHLSGTSAPSGFTNCVWYGNSQPSEHNDGTGNAGYSGALLVNLSSASLRCDVMNCTFAYNLVGGVNSPGVINVFTGAVTLKNSIVFGSYRPNDCSVGKDVYVRSGGSFTVDWSILDASRVSSAVSGATNLTLGDHLGADDPLFVTDAATVDALAVVGSGVRSTYFKTTALPTLLGVNAHLRGGGATSTRRRDASCGPAPSAAASRCRRPSTRAIRRRRASSPFRTATGSTWAATATRPGRRRRRASRYCLSVSGKLTHLDA